ncbi:MAG TPA: DinB family protein [Pyrinomonadaceae bacterium]|nr:DinB family protein [Pyrinomonadaceae bacterium]
MLEQLVEAWQINHRVTLRLLDALSEADLRATLSTRGGRDVARQLAHLHEVRAGFAEVTSKTNLKAKLPHFAKGESPSKKQLRAALEASAKGVETSIREGWANNGKLPGFKRGVIPFVGYLIAHESHHRGSILLTLKQTGHKLTDELKWGLWDWNKI